MKIPAAAGVLRREIKIESCMCFWNELYCRISWIEKEHVQ